MLALLIDPDKVEAGEELYALLCKAEKSGMDYIFYGGSLITSDRHPSLLKAIKENTRLPVILFPGSSMQVASGADAILFLSLISGRNPDFLIGNHVQAAPLLKKLQMEIISTGYMLVNCGSLTTAAYISNTTPLPYNKPEIAACTAMAGEMLGLKTIYMDGGSGADSVISPEMVSKVRKAINIPLIVGGGIKTGLNAWDLFHAGADVLVVGTAIEKNPDFLHELGAAKKAFHETDRTFQS